ncbi:Actin-related protein 5, partial [Araneus ventricosus]
KIYSLPAHQVKPDPYMVYSENLSKSRIPIIIDNGSYLCKAGWVVNEKPPLVFRNIAAKHRGKKESETQVGNDIKNIEAVRWLLKTQFDKNVVTQFDVQYFASNVMLKKHIIGVHKITGKCQPEVGRVRPLRIAACRQQELVAVIAFTKNVEFADWVDEDGINIRGLTIPRMREMSKCPCTR